MNVIDYIHQFHPYDALLIVPVVVTALLFWKHRRSSFTFFETLFGSVAASTFVTVIVMAIMAGPWPLIGITLGLIAALYVPICLIVGAITSAAARRT